MLKNKIKIKIKKNNNKSKSDKLNEFITTIIPN